MEEAARNAMADVKGAKTKERAAAKMIEMFPDEVADLERQEAELHGVVRSCEHLVDAFKKQASILDSLLYAASGAR